MKGPNAFCPETGASLSEETHYAAGRPQHHSTSDDPGHGGLLTNGALTSSRRALVRHFRECHSRHAAADSALHRAAAGGVARLKRADRDAWDVWLWTALHEHLARRDFAVDWMAAHAEPRCPQCAGPLAWSAGPDGTPRARCRGSCRDDGDRYPALRSRVLDLHNAAFDPVTHLSVA